MKFITAYHTDIGNVKKTNQDSLLIEQAEVENDNVVFAVACDGMGGLAKGELASATVVSWLSDWFNQDLPELISKGFDPIELKTEWEDIIYEVNRRIGDYGDNAGFSLGTTCVALLIYQNVYYIMSVGDSRAYLLSDWLYQLTKDQTYCQREIDLGRMTPEEATVHPQRSVLLQCIGASSLVEPDFFAGPVESGQSFLLCTDGFVHVLAPQEIYDALKPSTVGTDAGVMKQNLIYLVDTVKSRKERDNISALLVRTI